MVTVKLKWKHPDLEFEYTLNCDFVFFSHFQIDVLDFRLKVDSNDKR